MNLTNILGKRILFVVAHPDDESFLGAGLMHANASAGGENYLLCATMGEKGRAHLDVPLEENELKRVRAEELARASALLKVSDYELLDLGDGNLTNRIIEFETAILNFTKRHKADFLVGFAEDGFTGHSDHKASFLAGKRIAEELGMAYLAYAFPSLDLGVKYLEHLCKKRSHDQYHDHEHFAVGNIQVPINADRKLEALKCYQSQWKGLDPNRIFSEELAMHFLQFEYFKVIM